MAEKEAETKRVGPRRLFALSLILGILVFGAQDQIREIAWELRVDRWEAQCKSDGDQEACGRLAIDLVYQVGSVERMREGIAMFESLCDDKLVHRACTYASDLRSDAVVLEGLGYDDRRERLRNLSHELCGQGNVRGCFGLAEFRASNDEIAVVRAACEKGDELACYAWASLTPDRKARAAACASGFGGECGEHARGACLDGDFDECGAESDPAAQTLALLANVDSRNAPLHGVKIPLGTLTTSCEEGSAAACFVVGLNATSDINPMEDAPVATRSLDLTMGRSCELGANIACYVFALRLLDRPSPDAPARKRAEELLDEACDRGHVRSCWLRATATLDLADELDRYRDTAELVCRSSPPQLGPDRSAACAMWSHVLLYDAEIEPWLIADSEGFRRAVYGCLEASAPEACRRAAWFMKWHHDRGVPPLISVGIQVAREGCRMGTIETCALLVSLAQTGRHFGEQEPEALVSKICASKPEDCDDVSYVLE